MLRELEAPTWTAPPAGARKLDEGVVRLGTPIAREGVARRLAFVIPSQDPIAKFEIGDYPGPAHAPAERILQFEPGLYEFRVTWTDGSQYHSYLSLRCEREVSDGRCTVVRSFRSLR